mgnify:CR=1 FL=1
MGDLPFYNEDLQNASGFPAPAQELAAAIRAVHEAGIAAGSGVTGDLLAHCIDTAIWLNGSIKDVSAMTETFVKERVHAEVRRTLEGWK